MIQKSIIIFLLSCMGGAGLFLGGAEFGNSFTFLNSEVLHVTKKKNLVKPKSFYSRRKPRLVGISHEQLSFFSVLNDPSMTKMVGLNGKIIKSYEHFQPPVQVVRHVKKIKKKRSAPVSAVQIRKASLQTVHVPPVKPKKAIIKARREPSNAVSRILKEFPTLSAQVDTGASANKVEIRPALLRATEPPKTAHTPFPELVSFVVQVSSFRQMQLAEVLRDALGKKGYAAFIGKTVLPGNKGTWYRVNIGRYLDHAGAEMAAAKYYEKENRKAIVIRQSG